MGVSDPFFIEKPTKRVLALLEEIKRLTIFEYVTFMHELRVGGFKGLEKALRARV